MTANDREWELLSDLWRTSNQEGDRPPLRRLVAAHRRRLAAVVCGEALVVAGFARVSWLLVRDGAEVWETVWLTTLWSFTAVAVTFAWWNRKGTWEAMGETVAEFQRLRAVRRRRTLRFGWWLFLAEVLAVVGQLAWFDRFTPFAAMFLVLFSLAFGIWTMWMKKRIAIERRRSEQADG